MQHTTSLIFARFAVGFAFLYPAVSIHFNPEAWVSYFPDFVTQSIALSPLVWAFTALHLVIALWIMLGRRIFIPSALAAGFLAGVVLFNWSGLEVLFRDISLFMVCIALAIEGWQHEVWGIGSRSWTHHPDLA